MRRIAIITMGVLASACGVEKISGDEGGECVPVQVQQVFDARCALPGCHDGGPGGQGLSLKPGDSNAIIGQQAVQVALPLVELGNVDGSYLALKMVAMPAMPIVGTRMPQAANFEDPALQAEISGVIGWIAGAEFTACGGGTESGSETTAPTTSTTATTTPTESSGESSSTGEMPTEAALCGLDDLDPGFTNPIVSGDGAGVIPTEIGFIITHNCGCHLSPGPYIRAVAPYSGMADFTTLAGWLAPPSPTAVMTTYEIAITRVGDLGPIGMPPPGFATARTCDIGTGEAMPPAERDRLLEWLNATVPDGANWPP